jgi:hypothetical protein
MNESGPKILQIASQEEGIPNAYFFPRQHIGGIKNITRAAGNMVFRLGKYGGTSIHMESDVTIINTPIEEENGSSKDIVLIFKKENPLTNFIHNQYRLVDEEHQRALKEYCGEKGEGELTCYKIPQALLRVLELERIDLSALLSRQTIDDFADYMPMQQLNYKGKRAHVIQTDEDPKKFLNAELLFPDDELYLPTPQKVRFFPKVKGFNAPMLATSEPMIFERHMEEWDIMAISRSLRKKLFRMGVPFPPSVEGYTIGDCSVINGYYNRLSYERDLMQEMEIWSQRIRNPNKMG